MIVWFNGALRDSAEARIDPTDRGFTLGDGLFETIAVRGGEVLRLDAHLARLHEGCGVLGLPKPMQDLRAILRELIAANDFSEAAARITYTRGPAPRGVQVPDNPAPTLLVTLAPVVPEFLSPVWCIIAQSTRRNEFSPLSRIKSLNYLDNILARQEAIANNVDDAILLNTQGCVAEATSSNFFLIRKDEMFTPPVNDGALPGVMRAEIIQRGAVEQSLTPDDIENADGAFLSSSLGLRAVTAIGRKRFAFDIATFETFRKGMEL